MDLDPLLEQAGRPGEGRFTLDLRRAQELMSRYQLQDPTMYILKLVQWAVASQPTRVEVTIAEDVVVVTHDGVAPPDDLSLGSLVAAGEGALLHLAVGVFAALGQGAQSVTLGGLSLHGEVAGEVGEPNRLVIRGLPARRAKLDWSNQGGNAFAFIWVVIWLTLLAGPSVSLPAGVVMTLFAAPQGWNYLRAVEHMRADYRWVKERCVYAPVSVFLNGQAQDLSRHLHAWPAVARPVLEAGGRLPGPSGSGREQWLGPRGEREFLAHLVLGGQRALACRALLWEQMRTKYSPEAAAVWVKDGVIIEVTPPFRTNLKAIVDAGDLRVDLAQFALVKDERYQKLVETLSGLFP